MKIQPSNPGSPFRFRTRRGGYVLLELILSLIIFSIAVMSLARTLNMAIQTGAIINRENDIRMGLRSFLEEVRRKPLAELTQTYTDERLGVTFNSAAEPLTLKDRNGTVLSDLYKLHVACTFEVGAEQREEALDIYVYKTQTP
ncbi:MAG: hypothetical protein ACAI34_22280 [Verrucomicrobium sp.]